MNRCASPTSLLLDRVRLLALGACVTVLAHAGLAQQPSAPEPADTTVRLTGEMPISRLVDLLSEFAELPIHFSEDLSRRRVTIRSGEAIGRAQLPDMLEQVLQANGFVTVEDAAGTALVVLPVANAADRAPIHDRLQDARGSFRAVTFRADNRTSSELADAARPLLTPGVGKVTLVPRSRTLVLADVTPRLERAIAVLSDLDGTDAAVVHRVVELAHLRAEQAITTIQAIRAARATGAVQGDAGPQFVPLPGNRSIMIVARRSEMDALATLLTSLDAPLRVETRTYAGLGLELREIATLIEQTATIAGDIQIEPPRIVQDNITGSLVIAALPSQHQQIEELLERVGSIPPEARATARSFRIRNRPVEEVMDLLEDMLDTADPGIGLEGTAAPGAEALGSSLDRPGATGRAGTHLTADEGTSTIIATGPAPSLRRIEQAIEAVDIRQPQVEIEVLMLSLSETESRDLGIELQQLVNDAGTLVGLSSLFGLTEIAPSSDSPLIDGAGGTAVILDPGNFSVVVRALETINRGRSLSMPRVLVANNEDATVDSVLQQPFVSVNASDTVATTAFGGFEDAGTQVTVTPQIAAGDHLVVRYSVNLSSFVGESASANAPPPRQQNNISSVATIPDGYTVAIGGIELQTRAKAQDKTPLLADIPLIGNLFKSQSSSSSRQLFYVFIRANVLRSPSFEDLKYISDSMIQHAGLDDQHWPEVEPGLIR